MSRVLNRRLIGASILLSQEFLEESKPPNLSEEEPMVLNSPEPTTHQIFLSPKVQPWSKEAKRNQEKLKKANLRRRKS